MTARDSVPAPLTRSSVATVTIEVVFDNPPTFERGQYTSRILETQAVGTRVVPDNSAEIRAVDVNMGIVCSFVGFSV